MRIQSLAAVASALVFFSTAFGTTKSGGPETGDAAPPLQIGESVQAPEGADFSWDALRGNVVIVEFWATWCGPCIGAIPHINELAEHFKDDPVTFISISDEERDVVRAFLKKKEMKSWVVLDDDRATFDSYAVKGIPHTVIVDTNGVIAAVTHPVELTKGRIERALASDPITISEGITTTAGVDPLADSAEAPVFQVVLRETGAFIGASAVGYGDATLQGMPPSSIIKYTYDVSPTRIRGTEHLPDAFFTLVVKAPKKSSTDLFALVRESVVSAFGVNAAFETHRAPVLHLVYDAEAPHHLSEPYNELSHGYRSGPAEVSITNSSVSTLAEILESALEIPVINRAGIEGSFDATVTIDKELNGAPQEERIAAYQKAIFEQLGLRLEYAQDEIEFLVLSPQP